jgi:hypothetical protein
MARTSNDVFWPRMVSLPSPEWPVVWPWINKFQAADDQSPGLQLSDSWTRMPSFVWSQMSSYSVASKIQLLHGLQWSVPEPRRTCSKPWMACWPVPKSFTYCCPVSECKFPYKCVKWPVLWPAMNRSLVPNEQLTCLKLNNNLVSKWTITSAQNK